MRSESTPENTFATTLEITLSIYRQLKNYGLDWREWTIAEVKDDKKFRLRHQSDPDFLLEGRLQTRPNGRTLLHSLSIASL